MSYYEDVYLARLNKYGTTRKERIIGANQHQFENFLKNKTMYVIDFTSNNETYIGSLQPGDFNEKDIISYLLVSIDNPLTTGDIIDTGTQKWIILFVDPSTIHGYKKFKVILLDRVLTWWDSNKTIHTAPVALYSSMSATLSDKYVAPVKSPVFREPQDYTHIVMSYNSNLLQDNYCKLDNNNRRFIVLGYDLETVPNVAYVTLNVSPLRVDTEQIAAPSSSGGVNMAVRNYSELSPLLKKIATRLLADQNLCKLLLYNTNDPLGGATIANTAVLLGEEIRFKPILGPQETTRSKIVMVLPGGEKLAENSDVRQILLDIFVYTPLEEWVIKGDDLRIFLIMTKVEELLNGKEVGGIGLLKSTDFELALTTDTVCGYRMGFVLDVFS